MAEAIGVLAAKARFEGESQEVHTRIARLPNVVYLDLCNDRWEVVEVTADGWEVKECPTEVKFRRPKGMLPLPIPTRGGRHRRPTTFRKSGRALVVFVCRVIDWCFRERSVCYRFDFKRTRDRQDHNHAPRAAGN